jgi:hypothetical protein
MLVRAGPVFQTLFLAALAILLLYSSVELLRAVKASTDEYQHVSLRQLAFSSLASISRLPYWLSWDRLGSQLPEPLARRPLFFAAAASLLFFFALIGFVSALLTLSRTIAALLPSVGYFSTFLLDLSAFLLLAPTVAIQWAFAHLALRDAKSRQQKMEGLLQELTQDFGTASSLQFASLSPSITPASLMSGMSTGRFVELLIDDRRRLLQEIQLLRRPVPEDPNIGPRFPSSFQYGYSDKRKKEESPAHDERRPTPPDAVEPLPLGDPPSNKEGSGHLPAQKESLLGDSKGPSAREWRRTRRKGEKIYEVIRKDLETKYNGDYVAIDIEMSTHSTPIYVVGKSLNEVVQEAEEKFSARATWIIRVGEPLEISISL